MQLDGIHHITCITGDAPRNVDFYVRVLGLRMAKKTVNQDDPTVYHLFYADDRGSPGADLTFFEYPNARPGRDGAGMIHRIAFRVADAAALDFWAARLEGEGLAVERVGDGALRFADHEGLGLELLVDDSGDDPLVAAAPDIPAEHALRGFAGVRAYSADPAQSTALLRDVLGFEPLDGGRNRRAEWVSRGPRRGGFYGYDQAPEERGIGGAGTVHHIAWTPRTRTSRRGTSATPPPGAKRPGSSTASTSEASTRASRAACCSRSPRAAPASRPTSRPRRSGADCRCRRSWSTCASRSSRR